MAARRLGRRIGALAALLSVGLLVSGAGPTKASGALSDAASVDTVMATAPEALAERDLGGADRGGAPVRHPSLPTAGAAIPVPLPFASAPPAAVANPRTSWGPSLETVADARKAVAAMTVEQLAGQVLVVRYRESEPTAAAELVTRWHLGGVILMSENIADREQVAATTAAVHAAVRQDGRPWPGIVAVDQEGGRVARLGGLVSTLPPFAAFGGVDPAQTRGTFGRLGGELRALGITMDMAPVADVTIGPDDPTIGDRSASSDHRLATTAVLAASSGLLDGGVVPVLKHFPGHGSVTVDSHVALPVQAASVAALEVRDLVPFRSGVAAGAPVVMIGHLDLAELDPGVPASLSAATYRLLRDGLGFEGVTVTDSLAMGAVPSAGPGQETVQALVAGADLVLMPRDVESAHGAIVAAVADGRLSMRRLTDAAARVVALQMWSAEL